jgi:hypothetical protein
MKRRLEVPTFLSLLDARKSWKGDFMFSVPLSRTTELVK